MKKLAALILLLGTAAGVRAADLSYQGSAANKVFASSQNIDVDLNASRVDLLSVQVVYSSANPAAISLTDGTVSTGSINVTTLTGLATSYATNSITISSNPALSGAVLTFNGSQLIEGVQWKYDSATASNTAVSLCNAIGHDYSSFILSTTTVGGTVIYSTAAAYGAAANAFTLTSSTPTALVVKTATFTGGYDNAVVTIANFALQANRDWSVGANVGATALNIASAINTKLSSILSCSTASAVVYATSTFTGAYTNYTLTSSTPTALVVSGVRMVSGTNSDIITTVPRQAANTMYSYPYITGLVATSTNVINKVPTSLGLGHAVLFKKTAGTVPTGLIDNTTYFATNLTAANFQLSDTSTNAIAGVPVLISSTTLAGAGTFTLTPIALIGTPSFKLQKSNDGINFQDVYLSTGSTPCSVSFASPYTASTQVWDIGQVFFRYLRLAYLSGTWGGVSINELLNGKKLQ